jgi:hypothetical protein
MDMMEDSDENVEEEMSLEERNDGLMQAVKDNDLAMTEEFLVKGAIATSEKNGWNPLLWAAC